MQAKEMGACNRFKGTECTLEDIITLFLSQQGMEFCMNNQFPSLDTLRQFKKYDVEKYGIYIDAGDITLNNPKHVVLVGSTSATVTFDALERHEVYVLQGAKCTVEAYEWAVVRVQSDKTSQVNKNAYNNAVIL